MGNYSEQKIQQVWERGIKVNGYDENLYRKDICGAWIKKEEYGNRESAYGWEIDHFKPKSLGGTDDLLNLIPLQWENNRTKGDDYPEFNSSITAEGEKNIKKELSWKIE